MAKIRSGSVILNNGQRVYIDEAYISSTTMSGIPELHVGSYYGDGTYLTGIPRSFIDLLDTPVTYSGAADKYVRVKLTEDGLEFVTFSGSDPSNYYTKEEVDTISGTLHSQIIGLEVSVSGSIDKRGLSTVNSGSSSVSVTFDTPFSSSDYIVSAILSNKVDTPLDLYSTLTTAKSTTGFTVLFSGDIDYTNYYLEWVAVANNIGNSGSSTPTVDTAIFGGGQDSGSTNLSSIDYFDIATTGDASDFGDMTLSRSRMSSTSNGSNDRGILAFGPPYNNTIDYITISTPGNAAVFGYLSNASYGAYGAATSNNTNERGIYAGEGNVPTAIYYWTISTLGNTSSFGSFDTLSFNCGATSNGTNERGVYGGGGVGTKYITISTTGNSTNFGSLTTGRDNLCATSNLTNERGIFIGGTTTNIIDYITISTPGNATDFGDLVGTLNSAGATSNGTNERGVICGGTLGGTTSNVIQYVTISTTGNAADFGDLTTTRTLTAATSNA